jgi:hypothetical protein
MVGTADEHPISAVTLNHSIRVMAGGLKGETKAS